MQGRPLRFIGLVLAGWVGWRALMLWPVGGSYPVPAIADPDGWLDIVPAIARAEARPNPDIARWATPTGIRPAARDGHHPGRIARMGSATGLSRPDHSSTALSALRMQFARAHLVTVSGHFAAPAIGAATPPAAPAARFIDLPGSEAAAGRWQASAWLMTRSDSGRGDAAMLGGGQAGLAVRRSLSATTGAFGRITTPLAGQGAELALGLDWTLVDRAVRLVAERRIGLGGQPGGPALGMVAGIGPAAIDRALTLEAYGQIGMVWRTRSEPYADGFVRLARPVAGDGTMEFDLGVGAWGAAQRDAHRIDVGPSIGVRVPMGGRALRASVDWRQRVAGTAVPASGPALTLASDF